MLGQVHGEDSSYIKFSSLIFKSVCKGHARCFEGVTKHLHRALGVEFWGPHTGEPSHFHFHQVH